MYKCPRCQAINRPPTAYIGLNRGTPIHRTDCANPRCGSPLMALCDESFFRLDVIQQQLRDEGLEDEDDFRMGYVPQFTESADLTASAAS